MEICALSSGSSGNCFYIGDKKGVLVDAGISAKRIAYNLEKLGKKPGQIKGIFITHEHSDHVKGVDVFARQFNIPIFATKKTAENFLCSDESLINIIKNNETTRIEDLEIEAFSKSHSCSDPVSYSVSGNKRVSVITDIGYACKNVVKNVSESDFLFLESNHDLDMLESGFYSEFLKNWIKSRKGHLSNLQAALCVLEHASPKLKNVVLSHLSKNNNTPLLALETFSLLKERSDLKPKVSISHREVMTKMFRI